MKVIATECWRFSTFFEKAFVRSAPRNPDARLPPEAEPATAATTA
jgi:hypothetical protein